MNDLLQIEIQNKQGKVKLNEVVTKDSISKMIDEIGRLFGASAVSNGADFGEIMNVAENAVDVLDIEINSPGGSVFDGYTIYQEIKSLQDRGVQVNATITGLAASMASVIAMACDKISIVPHGRMMIHDASNITQGNADQLRKMADNLDAISEDIAGIYSSKTGKTQEEVRDLMKKETWMNATECLEAGFVDSIINYKKDKGTKNESSQFDIQNEKSEKPTMSILSKLFPNNSEVEKLEAHIAENDSLRAENADLQSKLEAVKDSEQVIIENKVKIETLTNELTAKDEQITELNAKLIEAESKAKDADESASAKAVEMLATIGQEEPLETQKSSIQETSKTRAEFNALDHIQRNEFIKNGGKIK
jgi:ATP-dependent Clp endopeptidase proteolytic subunit ClpP